MAKYKLNDILKVFKKEDGYWMDSHMLTEDCPEWGPYETKAEANEARESYLRNCFPERKKFIKDLTT